MQNIKHKLAFKILMLCMVMGIGFMDTGVFIKDFGVLKSDNIPVTFAKEEAVEILKESSDTYYVLKDNEAVVVPREVIVRTSRTSDNYKALINSLILDFPEANSSVKRTLFAGEQLLLISLNNEYGFFRAISDNTEGYVKLENLEQIVEKSLNYGVATISKMLKNETGYYALVLGEAVAVTGFSGGNFEIVDATGNKFIVEETAVKLLNSMEQVTRETQRTTSDSVRKVITEAYRLIGKPYVYASGGPNSFDCSGFTSYVFKTQLGIVLPRISYVQGTVGVKVEKSELIPGDLVFFGAAGSRISHVGLYIGEGNMIHASSGKGQIRIDTINSGWYLGRYRTARRVIQ